jgi:hypothetical protein
MKTTRIALIALLVILPCVVSAQEVADLPRLDPYLPQIWAQGGSATAVAEGFISLFTNPAGIKAKNEFSISASAWIIGNPVDIGYYLGIVDEETINSQLYKNGGSYVPGFVPMSEAEEGDVANTIKFVEKGLAQGLGAGSQASIGLTAGGLGLAANVVADAYLTGKNALDVKGYAAVNASLVAGLALDVLKLSDDFVLTVGGDVRPNVRFFAPFKASSLFNIIAVSQTNPGDTALMLNQLGDMHQGFGLGLDLGAKLKMGPFTVGLSIRDLFGTKYNFHKMGMGDFVAGLESGSVPEMTEEVTDVAWYVPMNITAGAAWRPFYNSGLRGLIDPVVHVDLSDPYTVITQQLSPWALLHVGAEAKILGGLFSARLGLNQGYVTAGAGIHLLFADINAAIFTRELGSYAGDKPSMGMSLEAAIRF